VPVPVAVASTVDLAAVQIGERVAGVTNAVMRQVASRTWSRWLDDLTAGSDAGDARALRTCHPRWIVEALADVVPDDELERCLDADNEAAAPTLAVRPGLADRDELVAQTGGQPTRYSPWGLVTPGDPSQIPVVRSGLAGVQDEGSQLMVLAATRAAQADAVAGPWLDMCAGPGGKTALLCGQAAGDGVFVVAGDAQEHRARLVAGALRGFDPAGHQVVVADGTSPAWHPGSFAMVLADVPCSGLGALRRRPDARWRRRPGDIDDLVAMQTRLLATALDSVRPGGLVVYVTCSPHRRETAEVISAVAARHGAAILDAPSWLPEVPDCAAATDHRFVQLWPHRHGTDAMFLALLKRAG